MKIRHKFKEFIVSMHKVAAKNVIPMEKLLDDTKFEHISFLTDVISALAQYKPANAHIVFGWFAECYSVREVLCDVNDGDATRNAASRLKQISELTDSSGVTRFHVWLNALGSVDAEDAQTEAKLQIAQRCNDLQNDDFVFILLVSEEALGKIALNAAKSQSLFDKIQFVRQKIQSTVLCVKAVTTNSNEVFLAAFSNACAQKCIPLTIQNEIDASKTTLDAMRKRLVPNLFDAEKQEDVGVTQRTLCDALGVASSKSTEEVLRATLQRLRSANDAAVTQFEAPSSAASFASSNGGADSDETTARKSSAQQKEAIAHFFQTLMKKTKRPA